MPVYNMKMPDGEIVPVNAPTPEAASSGLKNILKSRETEAQVSNFAQNIDTTAVEAPPPRFSAEQRMRFRERGMELPKEKTQNNADDRVMHKNAADNGVDITTGLPAALRASADLLDLKPAAKAQALDYLINEDLKKAGIVLPDGVPAVFKDEWTGKTAYWKPTEDGKLKATLVNGFGLDSGDSLSALDDVALVGAEVVGAIGGALGGGAATGGHPAGAIAGGTSGVMAANALINKGRKELARELGIPDEIVDQIDSDDMLSEALIAGGFEALGPAAAGGFRAIRNKWFTAGIKPDNIEELKASFAEVGRLSREIEEVSGVRITPSLGQSTGDEAILVAEVNAKRDAVGGKSQNLREADVRNRANTGKAITEINRQAVQTSPRLPDAETADLGEQAKEILSTPRRDAETVLQNAEGDQLAHFDEIADLWSRPKFAGVQEDLRFASEQAAKSEQIAWDNFRSQVELDPKTGQSNIVLRNSGDMPIPKVLAEISQESQNALSDSLRGAQKQMVEDLGWKVDPETGMIPRSNLADATLDGNQLHVLVSHLKSQARKEDAGQGLGWRGQDIHRVIEAIEDQMANGKWARRSSGREVNPLKNDYINASYELANSASVAKHQMFNHKAVKELYKQDADGKFLKEPGAVRGLIFKPGNTDALSDVLRVTGANPAKRAGMLEELNVLYKEQVLRDGKFSKGQHDAFLSQYNDHINMIADGDTTDFIRTAADMDRVVKEAKRTADQTKDALSDAYGRRLSSEDIYGGNIARDMLSDELTIKQITQVRNRLNRANPALWNEIKAEGMKTMEQKMLKSSGSEANFGAINKIITEDGERLGVIYGPKYLKNLENMRDILSISDRGKLAKGSKISLNPTALQIFRSFLGPLSPIQRKLTAGNKFLNGRRNAKLYDLISNPEKLENLVEWGRMSPGTVGFIQAGEAIFGRSVEAFLSDEDRERANRMEQLRSQNPKSVSVQRLREINDRRGTDASRHR